MKHEALCKVEDSLLRAGFIVGLLELLNGLLASTIGLMSRGKIPLTTDEYRPD